MRFEQKDTIYNMYVPVAGIQMDEPIVGHISEDWLISVLNEYLQTKEIQCCLLSLFYLFDNVSYELTFGEVNIYAPYVDESAYIGNVVIVIEGRTVEVQSNDITFVMFVNDRGYVDESI